jgi:hypothetical protein
MVVANLKVLSPYLPAGTEKKKNTEISVKIVGLRAEIWTLDSPNTKMEC